MTARQIAEVLAKHHLKLQDDPACLMHVCECGEWGDSGPGLSRVRHNYEEHVADAIQAALETTESSPLVWCSYYHDMGVHIGGVFATELEALRYAVGTPGHHVAPLESGEIGNLP
jgi:hypothetical protein